MKILIVEDEKDIAAQLEECLKDAGFVVRVEHDGEEGYFEGANGDYDAVLLDLGLPGMDGVSILEKWRQEGMSLPVIILTARTGKMETVRGLEAGADDYVTKPFDLEEVVARLRSNLRRAGGHTSNVATCGGTSFDMRTGRVSVAGRYIKLTRTEFLIVQYLFMKQGTPVSINELADHTYEDFDNDSGIIPKHIANIRKKIGHEVIQTETNRGYYVPLDQEK